MMHTLAGSYRNLQALVSYPLEEREVKDLLQILEHAAEVDSSNKASSAKAIKSTVIEHAPADLGKSRLAAPRAIEPTFETLETPLGILDPRGNGSIVAATTMPKRLSLLTTNDSLQPSDQVKDNDMFLNDDQKNVNQVHRYGQTMSEMIKDSSALSNTGVHIIAKSWHSKDQHSIFSYSNGKYLGSNDHLWFDYGASGNFDHHGMHYQDFFAWSPDDSLLALPSNESPHILLAKVSRIGKAQQDKVLNLNHFESGWKHYDVDPREYPVRAKAMAFNANGKILAVLSGDFTKIPKDAHPKLHIFETETGQSLNGDGPLDWRNGTTTGEDLTSYMDTEFPSYAGVLINSRNSIYLLDQNGSIVDYFSCIDDGRGNSIWEKIDLDSKIDSESARSSFCISPDRRQFACLSHNGTKCEIIDAESFMVQKTIQRSSEFEGAMNSVRFSPNGKQVVIVDDQNHIWEADTPVRNGFRELIN